MKYYVAGPFFDEVERNRMNKLRDYLRQDTKNEYFFPMEHFIPNGNKMSNCEWAEKVFKMDEQALINSDYVIAVYDRLYSDSGTAFEIGLAYGYGIPVILLCTDLFETNSIMPIMACDEIYLFEEYIEGKKNPVDVRYLNCLK